MNISQSETILDYAITEGKDLINDRSTRILTSIESGEIKSLQAKKFYEEFETYCEVIECLKMIQGKTTISSPQIARTLKFAELEGIHTCMNSNSKILFIGSGPFPESAMSYYTKFNCEVRCLDNNIVAVALSEKLFEALNLPIKITYCDGRYFDYKGYTHIILAVLSRPKEEILERIRQTNNDAIIICRTVDKDKEHIYPRIEQKNLRGFKLAKEIRSPEAIMYSLILNTI
ncbi:MAG TPA: nicotianamine synthase family protein [Alphaproteobacteria bacterium]|nr:nicotianamine synthase family protein [Alphaproteobacteria bacterium]